MLQLAGEGCGKLSFILMTKSGSKKTVLNLHCKGVSCWKGVLLLQLGFISPLSCYHLADVEQRSLPSYLWEKGNNFMPVAV